MSTETIYELIGYAGSILIVISLAMSSIIKLRVINLMGAITFGVYGFPDRIDACAAHEPRHYRPGRLVSP
jgi:hypothetical protein